MDSVKYEVIKLVEKELKSANEKFPLFQSNHEGYAIIKEEIEEAKEEVVWVREKLECIWELIRKNKDATLEAKFLKEFAIKGAIELIQVAAMAQKFIDSTKDKE